MSFSVMVKLAPSEALPRKLILSTDTCRKQVLPAESTCMSTNLPSKATYVLSDRIGFFDLYLFESKEAWTVVRWEQFPVLLESDVEECDDNGPSYRMLHLLFSC